MIDICAGGKGEVKTRKKNDQNLDKSGREQHDRVVKKKEKEVNIRTKQCKRG
jgi:hypothetical protein